MAAPRRIQGRLALAILLTALIPLIGAIVLAESAVRRSTERFYRPEVGARLDEALGLYKELARTTKEVMRLEAEKMVAEWAPRGELPEDRKVASELLRAAVRDHPNVVTLSIEDADGTPIASADRGRPLDPNRELEYMVTLPLSGERSDPAPNLVAVFAADKARFEGGPEQMSQFVDFYRKIEARLESDTQTYVVAFAVLLCFTILAAVAVGSSLARSVSSRIGALASATRKVGAGDLAVRVPERGSDEITDLARAFNRMLGEIESSRARIEYLQRIGAWQEMARRLAHEIKNPLTPIQLAVEEIHQRYPGSDPTFRRLLDTTLEVVEAEVGTLRRLVGEFSSFARLPQAQLEPGDLIEFLRRQRTHIALLEEDATDADPAEPEGNGAPLHALGVEISFDLPAGPAPTAIDSQMLRRALINLVRNAAQAVRGGRGAGRIRVTASRAGDFWAIDVDDDGPGIPPELRTAVFDPYVTTKADGTGLGLAIVKKIVVEHGGTISAGESSLGGARIRVLIPASGTPSARALAGEPTPAAPAAARDEASA